MAATTKLFLLLFKFQHTLCIDGSKFAISGNLAKRLKKIFFNYLFTLGGFYVTLTELKLTVSQAVLELTPLLLQPPKCWV